MPDWYPPNWMDVGVCSLIAFALGWFAGIILQARETARVIAERDVASALAAERGRALDAYCGSQSPLGDFLKRAEPEFRKLREQARAGEGRGGA